MRVNGGRLGAMTTKTTAKKILYIGGHGKIALLATPLLVKAGHSVDALVRNPAYTPELEALGAGVVVRDLTKQAAADWAELFSNYDLVIWGAGNGGRAGAQATLDIDRDGALATIDALESMDRPPRYVMISYLGATLREESNDGSSWDAYVKAKKAVDLRLGASKLDYLILGPSSLTDEPAVGIEVVADDAPAQGTHTARELVAQVIAEVAGRDEFPASPLAFVDGVNPVSSIG